MTVSNTGKTTEVGMSEMSAFSGGGGRATSATIGMTGGSSGSMTDGDTGGLAEISISRASVGTMSTLYDRLETAQDL